MKRLLLITASVIGLGSALLVEKLVRARKRSKDLSRDKETNERKSSLRGKSRSSRMAVKQDGSLQLQHAQIEEAIKQNASHDREIHLKKNGEPDRRYRENRDDQR